MLPATAFEVEDTRYRYYGTTCTEYVDVITFFFLVRQNFKRKNPQLYQREGERAKPHTPGEGAASPSRTDLPLLFPRTSFYRYIWRDHPAAAAVELESRVTRSSELYVSVRVTANLAISSQKAQSEKTPIQEQCLFSYL